MSFSDLADVRIKAALETVVTQSAEAAQRELDAFHAAVETRYEAFAASLVPRSESLSSAMLAELIADLTRLAEEEARVVADAVRREALEQSQQQLETERLNMKDRLEAAQAQAHVQLEVEQAVGREALAVAQAAARAEMEAAQATLRAELEAEAAENLGTLTQTLGGAQAEAVRLRTQIQAQREASLAQVEAAHAETEAARAETRALIDAQAQLETALAELRAQLQTERATKAALSKDLKQVRVEAEQAREEAEAARQNARTQVIEALAQAETAKREARVAQNAAAQALPEGPAAQAAPSADGPLDAFLTIDHANSLGEVLNALLEHLAVEFSRAALFVVQADRLRQWRSVGFHDPATDLQKFELPLTVDSPLTRAVLHRQPFASDDLLTTHGVSSGEEGAQPAVVFPICIADSVVAVAYADSGQPTGNGQVRTPRLEVAETLVSRAARRLTVLLAMSRELGAQDRRPVGCSG